MDIMRNGLKDEYVVTYFKYKEGYSYYNNQILKHGKLGNKKWKN